MTVMLEVISCHPKHQNFPLPLLFIHGAHEGAWIWNEHFLSFFASHGYTAHAVSLRGHGGSSGSEILCWASVSDYVDDVQEILQRLGGIAILIGHSMGTAIVLQCLRTRRIPAAVLMAPVPINGLLEASILLAWRDPVLFWELSLLQSSGLISTTGMRRALFSNGTPDSVVQPYLAYQQAESQRAIIDMMWMDLSQIDYTTVPLLVCGASQDSLFPKKLTQRTAKALQASLCFFSMGHAMMLEPNWREPAVFIHSWLQTLTLQ